MIIKVIYSDKVTYECNLLLVVLAVKDTLHSMQQK